MKGERPLVAVFDLITSVGGVQSVMAAVLPRLAERLDVVVIDPYNHPEYAELMQNAGVRVVRLGEAPQRRYIGGRTPLGRFCNIALRVPWLLLTMRRLRAWVRKNRPDIVYFNQLPASRVFSRAMPREGPKLVYHAHGFRGPEDVGSKTARLLSRRFACAFAVSRITADLLVQAGADRDKVRVVYNAVDSSAIRRRAESDGPALPPKAGDCVVFTHVAVVNRHKKAQHLGVEALAQLPNTPVSHLWICGDVPSGGDRSYLAYLRGRVKDLGLQGRVHFLGWRTDVPRVLKQSDVCILPSRDHSESFGMVLAEAMALGKPCIGSNFGGVPEVIADNETGLVCEPTVEALAEAMARLAASPDVRATMGQAGRRRVEEMFSLDRQADEIAGHLRSVVDATEG
jgi:glycosyltransferase involved in cell wall biosynthesis